MRIERHDDIGDLGDEPDADVVVHDVEDDDEGYEDEGYEDAEVIPMPGVDLTPRPAPVTDMVVWDETEREVEPWQRPERAPVVVTSVFDARLVPTRGELAGWLSDCYGALEVRSRFGTFHVLRLPVYYGRTLPHVPRGLARCVIGWWAWVDDRDSLHRRRAVWADTTIAADKRSKMVEDLIDRRRVRRIWRWAITAVALVMAPALAAWAWGHHRWWTAAAAAVAVAGVGLLGGRRDQIVQHVEMAPAGGRMSTTEEIIAAFYKAKILAVKDEPARVYQAPIRDGDSWTAHVAAPEGVAVSQVAARLEQFASALGTSDDCMEIEPLKKAGRSSAEFLLHVAMTHPAHRPPAAWPLMHADRHSIFRPFPIGRDLRGRPVPVSLMFAHTLIGAAPRLGKTTLLRMMACATLLDPRADLMVVDFGGGMDFKPFEPFCRRFILGEGMEAILEFHALLGWLRTEYQRRQARLRTLDIADVPEGRITEALAHQAGFRPITVIVDEFQVATRAGKLGEQIATDWAELEKVCLKVGIQIIAATQSADDSVPTELRNIAIQRFALTLATYQGSIALLGNDAYQRGLDASKLDGVKGWGIAWGADSDHAKGYKGRVALYNCTVQDAAGLLARLAAEGRRQMYDHAAERQPEQVGDRPAGEDAVPLIVRDVLAVWPQGQMHVHRDHLARLMDRDPGELTKALRDLDVPCDSVRAPRSDGKGTTQRGWRLADVEAARR